MTLETLCFKADVESGLVKKAGVATFFDGKVHTMRVLWYDRKNNKNYVILRGEAYPFKAYTIQDESGVVRGHI